MAFGGRGNLNDRRSKSLLARWAHLDAFKFLHAEIMPDEKAIEAMSESQLDEHLAGEGIDVKKLNERIAELKKKFGGQFALLAARQKGLEVMLGAG